MKILYTELWYIDTHLLARDCYRGTLLYNTSLHHYANNNRTSRVEDVLGQDSKLAWKYRNVFEFFTLLLLEFLVKEIRLLYIEQSKNWYICLTIGCTKKHITPSLSFCCVAILKPRCHFNRYPSYPPQNMVMCLW